MKELRLTQKEVVLMPVEDGLIYKAIMDTKLKEQGITLEKPIEKHVEFETGDIIYSQII